MIRRSRRQRRNHHNNRTNLLLYWLTRAIGYGIVSFLCYQLQQHHQQASSFSLLLRQLEAVQQPAVSSSDHDPDQVSSSPSSLRNNNNSKDNTTIPSADQEVSDPKQVHTIERTTTNFYQWKCSDQCSCLPHPHPLSSRQATSPPPPKNMMMMHQSYKSADTSTWPKQNGWKHQRQTWITLHPHWYFVFWNDTQNELLARCLGYTRILKGRTGIQKADLARMMYLWQYGGLYTDLDYVALQNHNTLFALPQFQNQQILLQGRPDQLVSLEWGYARSANHPFWKFCLDMANRQPLKKRQECPIVRTGPAFLKRCLIDYFHLRLPNKQHLPLEQMVSYSHNNKTNTAQRDNNNNNGGGDVMILEPRFLAPITSGDYTSECGQWRNIAANDGKEKSTTTNGKTETEAEIIETLWTRVWPESQCTQHLIQNGTFAVTFYSHSWGDGIKC